MSSFPDVDVSVAVHQSKEGTEIDLLVSPNSGRSEIVGIDQWRKRVTVKLRSPPEKGEANAELEKLLSEKLGSEVKVIHGHTARMKTALVQIGADEVVRKLGGHQ
ncbi:MAG: DUF167 family protein [Methanomassiliicoccales archaeon]|nr:DUF167 family protein [Methanomassiliicoccales archaeon]